MKSQATRLLDVAVLGPALVYAGTAADDLGPNLRFLLTAAGAATVAYNAYHYLELEELGALVGDLDPAAQAVRLFDVVVLGPAMIRASSSARLGELTKAGLALGGALTIVNNARNWLEGRD